MLLERLIQYDSIAYEALSRCRFNIFNVQVEKREIGTGVDPSYPHGTYECMECEEDPDHEVLDEGDSIADTDWTLKAVLFDKKEPRKPLTLNANPDSILQGDIFEDTLPHEEGGLPDDCDEPFKPDSYGFTRYYRSLALLIVPQATTVTYLTESSSTRDDGVAADLLECFSSKCTLTKSDGGFLNTLVSLCELFFPPKDVKSDTRMDIPEHIIIKILEAAMACHSRPLFDLVWDNNSANHSPQFFLQMLAKVRESSMLTLERLISALDRSAFSQKTISERFKFIRDLNGITDKPPKELEVHILDLFDEMIDLCYQSKLFEQDGKVFVWIACCYRDYEWLLKTIDPLIHKQCENIAFILGFYWELYTSITHNRLHVSDSSDWIKTTIRSLIARLDVRNHLLSINGFQCWEQDRETQCQRGDPNEMPIPPPPPPVTCQSLLNLCILLLDLGMDEDLRDLARNLTNQSGRINPFEFVPLFVPFVGSLMDILENRPVSLEDPVLSALIRTIIVAFWNGYVIPGEPVWEEPRYEALDSCACGFCVSVKLNLQKPKIKSLTVKEKEDRAKRHIAKVLKDLAWESHCSYHRHNAKTFSTWYITKLPTKYEKQKSIWDKRVIDARTQLSQYNQRKLWQVLGPSDYCCITGNSPPYFESPRTDATMLGSTMGTQAPEHAKTMPQISLPPPPDNLYGNTPPSKPPPVHNHLPPVAETSCLPSQQDNPPSHRRLPQPDQGVVNAWPSLVRLPATHPKQLSALSSACERNNPVQTPRTQVLPGRPPRASFSHKMASISGPRASICEEVPVRTGLKHGRDDDIVFIGERQAKR